MNQLSNLGRMLIIDVLIGNAAIDQVVERFVPKLEMKSNFPGIDLCEKRFFIFEVPGAAIGTTEI